MSRTTQVGLEVRLLAALEEHGPLTNGRLRQLTGPNYQTSRIAHGRQTVAERNELGLVTRRGWETFPAASALRLESYPEGGRHHGSAPPCHASKEADRSRGSSLQCPTTTEVTF